MLVPNEKHSGLTAESILNISTRIAQLMFEVVHANGFMMMVGAF